MRNGCARWWWLVASLLLGPAGWPGAVSEALADGKVLAPVLVPQDVAMPDQRALLSWRDGVETLVIESAFVGKGTDFAWVVPLPSKPEVEAATRGTLPATAALMLPVVVPADAELWWLVAMLVVLPTVALTAGWRAVGCLFRAAVLAAPGLVVGAICAQFIGFAWLLVPLAGAVTCWMGRGLIRRRWSLFMHLNVLIFVVLAAGLGLPTVATVGSSFGGAPTAVTEGVEVERRIVGDFDVAILSGREGAGVVGWLAENGFALPEAARVVAAEHAVAGGWFVASRVRREFAESGRSVPAPLVFRFATERPVYPMRFTGAGTDEALEVELFVFGPERAAADGLDAVAWGPVRFAGADEWTNYRGTGQSRDERVVTHPALRRLAEGAAVVTHLRGRLTPAEMQADLSPRWEAADKPASGLEAWAREAAWQLGLAVAGALALVGAIVIGFRRDGTRPPWRWSLPVAGVALAVGAVAGASRASVAVRAGKNLHGWELRQLPYVAMTALSEVKPEGMTEARELFAAELAKFAESEGVKLSQGDGPGQVEFVRLPTGKWRVYVYDAAGQARCWPEADF